MKREEIKKIAAITDEQSARSRVTGCTSLPRGTTPRWRRAGFDPQAVRSYLAANGLLRLSGDGRRVVSKKLHGVSAKCVCVKMGG